MGEPGPNGWGRPVPAGAGRRPAQGDRLKQGHSGKEGPAKSRVPRGSPSRLPGWLSGRYRAAVAAVATLSLGGLALAAVAPASAATGSPPAAAPAGGAAAAPPVGP